ncbi:sarcoplasmic calcium-binding protein-like [Lingula anatina]|uniref:Sarcoplasmic calcium-binding protein-like n=1 Tax=Lingula anatina TaxID=7574 RepID=A0A1S3HWE5_LINAN|nr:sarcoplasmic calcium-binding protein-like [Lingula anatina]|eukprot:XP_013390338.1 sarcoplasmic calcium-binding protein-like [Lingula anatina]
MSVPFPNFWVRKIRSFFVLFDRDLDGVVHREDYVDKVIERAKKYLSEEKVKHFETLIAKAWDEFWGGPEGKTALTIDELITFVSPRVFSDSHFAETCREWLTVYFQGVDANDDGYVTLSEYTAFLECFNVHPFSVTPSFEVLDTNHDGLISLEEFINTGTEYFCVTADTPAKLFWGPFLA